MSEITSLEHLQKYIKNVDEDFFKFAKQVDMSGDVMQQYEEYMKKAGKATSAFGATLKSVGANIGIMLAITLAVQALSAAFDYLNVTMEEQQEIVDGVKAKLDELQTEYDELAGKGNLTEQEKNRLAMLERQLEVQNELYKVEMKRLAESDLEGKGDLFSDGNLANLNVEMGYGTVVGGLKREVQENIDTLDEYRSKLNEVTDFNWSATSLANMEKDTVEDLKAQRTSVMEQWKAYSDSYELIKKYLDAGVWNDDPEQKSYYKNLMNQYETAMNDLQSIADNIDLTLGVSIDVESAKNYLKKELQNAGKYDEDWLNSLSDEEIQYLFRIEDIGKYSPEDLKDMISDLREEAEEPVEIEITTSDILTNLEDDLSEGFEKIAEIYKDVADAGDFDFGNLSKNSDFGAIFGETEGFNEFIETVSKSPSDINACQNAFDKLVTSWFYAKSPLHDINEENKQSIVNWMKSKGVINAEAVATYALAKKKDDAFFATRNLIGASEDQINVWIAEAQQAGLTETAIYQLELALVSANDTELDFSQQIEKIHEIATEAGVATVSLTAMNTAMNNKVKTLVAQKTGVALRRGGTRTDVNVNQENWTAAAQQQAIKDETQKVLKQIQDNARQAVGAIEGYKAPSGSGGSSGSSSDPHIAEVDTYKSLTDAVDEYDRKLQQLERTYEHTDDVEERIGLKKAEIKLYQEQKDAIDALNKTRDAEISDKVNKLRGVGFEIEYDPTTENLLIKNREHINDLNQNIIEEYEDYLNKVDELNDANKESADQWDELTYAIADANKEIKDLEKEQYEDYIEGAKHVLRLMENRKDAFGKESSVYTDMMNTTLKRWADLVKADYDGNIDDIRDLEEAWMDFYDARIEKEKEILEMQLDDNDSVLNAIIKVIDDQIKCLDDQIDGLSKANDERKKALELQKAQAELDKQRNQKTRMVLRYGVGWVWESDDEAIKEAEENLSDLEYESKVDALEEEKEALEDLKEKWEEIPNIAEDEQNRLLMIEKLGANAEEDILNDRIDTYEDFKDDYIDIQEQIKDKTDELEEHTSAAYLNVVKAFENMAKLAGIGLDTGVTTQTTQSSWYVGKDGKAPSEAKVGDLVYTKGGTYRIDAKDENGKFTSTKINNVSTPISENQWGTKISDKVIESTEDITDSVENIVRVNEDLINNTKKQILKDTELQKYIADNSKYTAEEIVALMDNEEVMDMLSDYTDDNSDATEENTDALYRFIDALANLELEVPLEEEMTLENFDDSIMDESDQAYIKELQRAWNLAMEQGNIELANQIHAMADEARLRYLDDDPDNDYNAIAKKFSELANSEYEYKKSVQIGGSNGDSEATQKYLDNISWLRDKADWSDEFIDRLDNVVDAIENGSGLTATVYEDQYGRTSTVIDYTDKKTPNTTTNKTSSSSGNKTSGQQAMDNHNVSQSDRDKIAQAQKDYNDAKAKGDTQGMKDAHNRAESIRNQNGYSGGDDGSKDIAKSNYSLAKSVDNSTDASTYSGDSSTYSGDASYDAADSISETGDKVVSGVKDAVSDIDVNVNVSGGSSGSKSGSGSGSSGTRTTLSDLSTAKAVSTTSRDSNTGKSTRTTTTYKTASGKTYTKTTVTPKKAKGGLNLPEDTYNTHEKGDEIIIDKPDEGNWVRINTGGSVIPHEVSAKLWDFGENPKMFLSDVLGYDSMKMNNQIVYTAAGSGQKTVSNHYTIENVSLPNVTKPDEFWDEFTRNLPNEAKQWSSTGY